MRYIICDMTSPLVLAARRQESFAVELHRAMLEVEKLSDVRHLLALFVAHFELCGAILWEDATDAREVPNGELFIQAQYFLTQSDPPFYRLPSSAITAGCIRNGVPARHARNPDGNWDGEVNYPEILKDAEIDAFVSVPIQLQKRSSTAPDSAITFYRSRATFSDTDYEDLQLGAQLLPAAYRFTEERASLRLVTSVQTILSDADFPNEQTFKTEPTATLDKVLGSIAQTFQFEVCLLYMHNPTENAVGIYPLTSSLVPNWGIKVHPCYEASDEDGGTGWVLSRGRPVRLFDMARYESEKSYYEKVYPGLEWRDRYGMTQYIREHLGLTEPKCFPLSYVCVPIVSEGRVTGALRCCISRNGPYHVDDDVLATLETVAGMIANWWDYWTYERQRHEEHAAALSIMSALGGANQYVTQRGDRWYLDKTADYLLNVARRAVPEANFAQARLRSSNGDLQTIGDTAATVSSEASRKRTNKSDAALYVLSNGKPLHVEDAVRSPFYWPEAPLLRSFTAVPITKQDPSGPMILGAIILGATKQVAWPRLIENSLSFLAGQLALYLSFTQQLQSYRQAQEQLATSLDEQGQLLLDFQHQLRTPINIAKNSADLLRSCEPRSETWNVALESLSSATIRARTVSNNLQFFVNLAKRTANPADCNWYPFDKILTAAKLASRFIYNRGALDKKIEFEFQPHGDTVHSAPLPKLFGNLSLIELGVDNLLDNAVKYSFDNTRVLIEAGSALYGREVYLSFRNQGLSITKEDAIRFKKRGHRGESARVSSPEGTGIGLWMVDEIMRSMEGRLEVIPTDAGGWNEIRLIFKGSAQ